MQSVINLLTKKSKKSSKSADSASHMKTLVWLPFLNHVDSRRCILVNLSQEDQVDQKFKKRKLRFKKSKLRSFQTSSDDRLHQSQEDDDDSIESSPGSNIPTTTSRAYSNSVFHDCRQIDKGITFGPVQIRHYDLTIGDNPSTREGPSISFDWTYKQRKDLSIDTFEEARQNNRRSHQQERGDLFLSPDVRKKILRNWGHSKKDLRLAEKEVGVVRKQRKQTMEHEMNKIRKEKRS